MKKVPAYTLPAIHDPATNTYLSNSFDIARYLDRTYPNKPHIFPHNTAGVQAPFARAFALNMEPIFNFLIPEECAVLNPRSQEYFRRTRKELFRVERLEDLIPKGEKRVTEWAKVKLGLDKTDKWFKEAEENNGPFIMGATPCWADFVVGGYMSWARAVWGEESEEWEDIASWNDGRWKRFVEGLKKYEEIK
ncbi:Glutathione S-transferase-like protein ustS [Psilocybe cubensis]|nr:Glutathione S-transferase-like protein ustS [Psilocybe cubensis]KAH9480870.1 Glutathione S-transferase-like protein ustS [Psilocybe cubensis]